MTVTEAPDRAADSLDAQVAVSVACPPDPPTLSAPAARILLKILRDVAARR